MLLLAVDTSGRQGGITLARGDGQGIAILESAAIAGGTFSAELVPQVADLLSKHGLTAGDLEAIVAVTGPGSFTGLRVGLSAVKGLSEALSLPIAAVTSLEVLIAASGKDSLLALLDAGRGEVYAGVKNRESRDECLVSVEEARQMAKNRGLPIVVADAALAAKLESAELLTYCSSEVAARLGLKKLLAGETVDVLALDANYIRKSEAEYLQKTKR